MKIMNNNEKLAKLAVNKSLLKEYSNSSNERIVYMNDGTEFQIQVFNPYSYVIGVSFSFNENNNWSNSQLLVLRPGERVWLDRYLDKESKLLFSTYKVGASEEVKKAIQNNGNLCIRFYKEKEKNYYDQHIYVSDIKTYKPYDYDWDSIKFCTSTCDANVHKTNLTSFQNTINGSGLTTTCNYASTFTSSNSIDSNIKVGTNSYVKSKSIETGRIEEGRHSNQKFNNVYKDFETWAFKTEYIKILPSSQKQVNSNDLQKKYCYECGKKLNPKFKFCPSCGAKQ